MVGCRAVGTTVPNHFRVAARERPLPPSGSGLSSVIQPAARLSTQGLRRACRSDVELCIPVPTWGLLPAAGRWDSPGTLGPVLGFEVADRGRSTRQVPRVGPLACTHDGCRALVHDNGGAGAAPVGPIRDRDVRPTALNYDCYRLHSPGFGRPLPRSSASLLHDHADSARLAICTPAG